MYIYLKTKDFHAFICENRKDKNILFGKKKSKMFLYNVKTKECYKIKKIKSKNLFKITYHLKTSDFIKKIVKSYDFFKYCKNVSIN